MSFNNARGGHRGSGRRGGFQQHQHQHQLQHANFNNSQIASNLDFAANAFEPQLNHQHQLQHQQLFSQPQPQFDNGPGYQFRQYNDGNMGGRRMVAQRGGSSALGGAPHTPNIVPEIPGSLAQINFLFGRLIRQDYDPTYTKRTITANQLANFIFAAPFGSEIVSPQAANMVLMNYELVLEGALEDFGGSPQFKQSIIRIITALGYSYRFGASPFFQWLFDRLLVSKPMTSRDQEIYFKQGLLSVLKELISLSDVPTAPTNIHEFLIDYVISSLQTLLDQMEFVDLLPGVLDVIVVISEKYPNQFRVAFKDIISLLIGWHIDPKVPKPIGTILSDTFRRLWTTWRERLAFGLEVIGDLTGDLEDEFNNQDIPPDASRSRVSPRLMSLLRCCIALVQAVCFAVYETVNSDAGMVLQANPRVGVELIALMQQILGVILNVGTVYCSDRLWRTMGIDFIKFLSACLGPAVTPLQLQCLRIHALEIDAFCLENMDNPASPSDTFKFTDSWLKSLDELISLWIPVAQLDPELLNFFVSPLNSPLLAKLRPLCSKDKGAMSNVVRSCRSYIQLIQKGIVERGPGDDGVVFGPQVDSLFEIVGALSEFKLRKKAAGFNHTIHTKEFLNLNEKGVSLGIHMESFLGHFKTLCESEAATLKHVLLSDFSLVLECVACGVRGFDGTSVFSSLENALLVEEAEYLRYDWWIKVEAALFLEFFEADQRLKLFSPSLGSVGTSLVLRIISKLTVTSAVHNHFVLGALWLKNVLIAVKQSESDTIWIADLQGQLESIIMKLISRLDFEADYDLRISIGEIIREYWYSFGFNHPLSLDTYSPVFRRLKDVHPQVREFFSKLIADCVDPLLASPLDEYRREAESVSCYFKISVMASPNLGNFRWSHFDIVMKAFGIHPLSESPKPELSKTLLRTFHVCQASKVLNQAAGLLEETELRSYSSAYLSEDLLVFWALWESARFCILSRLRTPFGNPEQTFGAIESILSSPTLKKDSKPVNYLIQFVGMLELQIHNAINGTASNLPPAPKSSVAFFHANRGVCSEWFSRIRSRLVTAGSSSTHGNLVWNALEGLKDFGRLKGFDQSALVAMNSLVASLGSSLVAMRDPDSLVGLKSWVEKHTTWEDMNTSWIDGFISLADHQYETGLNQLEDVSLGAGQNSIVNTILEHKAVLNDGSFLDSLEDSQNYGRLLISAETLSRWKDLETQNLEESGVSYLNDLVCTAVSTNSVKHLPAITTQRSDLLMVLEKVPDLLDAIAEDLLSRISVNNSASTVKILMQVKSVHVLKDRFSGESGADLKINPSLLAKETFPVLANLLKSNDYFDMNHENQLNLWLLTRTTAREVNCFNVAKDLAYTWNSPIDYPDIEVIDSIESKRLELVQSKLGSNFLELVAVCREDGGKKYSANVRQIQAKALLACSKHVPEINWDVDFDTVMASLGGNMENISESCLNLATSISPDFGKAWLLRAQFSYSQGLALVDEVRLKRFVSLKRSFDEIHTLVNYPEIALSEFTSKIASVFVVELADQTTSKSSSGYQKGQLQKNLESAFSFISSKCSEAITLALQDLKATIVSHFKEAVMGYFKFLELDSLNANANTQTNVVLRLLRVLTTYDEEFEEEFRMQFTRSPVQPWLTVIPQLFACLGHSSPVVGNAIVPLLVRIAKEAPELIVYYYVVGTRSARVIRSPSLQKLYDQIKTGLNPTYTEHIGHLLDEFQKVTVLWEEIWFNKLTYLNSEAPKRLHQFGVEMSRLKSHPAMKSTIDIKEKYRILLFPVISAIERLLKETIEMSATTNHEMWFTTSYKDRILTALNRLREPVDLGSTKGLWEPFVQIMNDINKDFQQNRHLQLFNLSAKLQHLATLSVPLPVSGITADKLIIERFGERVRILPTKTKPKRIEIITSNGSCRPFLLKGLEDLRLDERIQQTLKVANSLLQTDKQSRTRNLNARTYDIFPLGDHFGMIEWIDNISQLFSIFKRWQMRDFAVRTSLSGKEGEVLQRPHEMFNTKLAVALKKHGVARNVSRRDWPSHVLTGVFKELCNETPNNLVKSELWAASPSADLWWEKTVTFSRSMGVNSILGYLIGLGDRHLDNIMVDCKKGEVVHIDYNVCFEKGLRLRVPENVPFRLTQNLVGAMGVGGIEGVFRISCNLTLGVLQNNKDVLLALLDSFVYDPIVDWAIDDEALEGKLEGLNLNVKFMWSRIAENKDDIVEAVQSLPQSAAYVYREMQNFVERSSRNHDIQKEIDLLTSEMKDLEIGGRVVKVTDETMLREELKSALNDSGVWYSKHQMAIAAILNPQLDEYLSSLNVNTSLVMDHLLTAASIETDEFDQRLLEVIEARGRHLQLLYQRLKAYQVLVAPIVNGVLAQDLRQKVVQVLSGFGQSSAFESLRQTLLIDEPSIMAKTIDDTFVLLEKAQSKKIEEREALKHRARTVEVPLGQVEGQMNEMEAVQQSYAVHRSHLNSLNCCVLMRGVEVSVSILTDVSGSSEAEYFASTRYALGHQCGFVPMSLFDTLSAISIIKNWLESSNDLLVDVISNEFETDVLTPLRFMNSLGETIEEFSWQIVGAVSNISVMLLSSDASLPLFLDQLEKLCRPFLMISDQSNEFQQHSSKLREEYSHLMKNQGRSTAAVVASVFENVFGPLEAQILELHMKVAGTKEDEALRNRLFVSRVQISYSLIESIRKYLSTHQSTVWTLEATEFKNILSEDNHFREASKRLTDFITLINRDVMAKGIVKVLQRVPKKLAGDYVKGMTLTVPKTTSQNLKMNFQAFIEAAVEEWRIEKADIDAVEEAVFGLVKAKVGTSIYERGCANIARLEWNLGNQTQSINRFQYLYERVLRKSHKIKNIREEILAEFQLCSKSVERDLDQLRELLNELNNFAPSNSVTNRVTFVNDEIGRITTILDITHSLIDFEHSRTPSPSLFPPIQNIITTVTKLETLSVRKSPSKEGYEKVIQSLQQKVQSNSVDSTKVLESIDKLTQLYDAGKSALKRLHSALDRVARSSQGVEEAAPLQKKLKLFWAHWPHLGNKLKKWVQETKPILSEGFSLSAEDSEALLKKARWLSDGVSESVKAFVALLNEVAQIKSVSENATAGEGDIVKRVEGDDDEDEDSEEDSDSEDEDDEEVDGEKDGDAGGSQKAQATAGNVAAKAVKGVKNIPERNAYALNIINRVQAKLDGMDGVKEGGERMSVADQVEMVIQQAQSVENLSKMYEGWMSWI